MVKLVRVFRLPKLSGRVAKRLHLADSQQYKGCQVAKAFREGRQDACIF